MKKFRLRWIVLLLFPILAIAESDRMKEADELAADQLDKRIVGGEEISISERPWQVAILLSRYQDDYWAHFCGGTLINQRWVLTAAHCVDEGTTPAEIQVLTSSDQLNGTGNRFAIESIEIHSEWDKESKENDIALLKLNGRVGEIDSIPIATDQQLDAAAEVLVSGWGKTRELGSRVEKLQGVTLPMQSRSRCNRVDSYDGQVTETMFCAGRSGGGQDSCSGDSGGPATIAVGGVPTLAGVVSWGDGCARAKKYGIYTMVPLFIQWIETTSGLNLGN